MASLAAGSSVSVALDADDVLTVSGNATASFTPTTGSNNVTTYLTGTQTLGPYKQFVTVTLTALNAVTYSTASDTSGNAHAVYATDSSGNITGFAGAGGVPSDITHGRTILVTAATLTATPSALQTAHDTLKASGGGHVVLEAGATYTPTALLSWDTAYCGLRFNGAKIDISGIGAGNAWLTLYSSLTQAGNLQAVNREFSGGWIDGGFVAGAGNSSGVTAIRFNSTTSGTSNRVVLRNMRIAHCYKGFSFANRSYFVRTYDTYFYQNGIALYQEASPTDFAELNSFTNCVIAENDIHLSDVGGQIWKFSFTSFDYHQSRLMNLTLGATVHCTDCHFEWTYGATAGQTNMPFVLTDSNTSFYAKGCTMVYADSGQNPYYTATFSVSNNAQIVDVQLDKANKLGRLTDTTGLDCFAYASTLVSPTVRLRAMSQSDAVADVPAMTFYSDPGSNTGVGGLLRNGVDTPYNELAHRIALTGTAAISSVTATENGVSLKNGAAMLKITGVGKVCINFPIIEAGRRHVWEFFTNPAFLTGSVTIKERQTGYGSKFDGTTVTNVTDTRGAVYSGTTVTVSNGADAWTRRSWKNCNSAVRPSRRQDMAQLVQIEIDTASMSAGALYCSHFAFDMI